MQERQFRKEWAQEVGVARWHREEFPRYICYCPAHGRGVFECKKCGRRFPDQYVRTTKNSSRSRRGEQYFKLAAWNNFRRHLDTCKGERDEE